jgi:hypothetical protein
MAGVAGIAGVAAFAFRSVVVEASTGPVTEALDSFAPVVAVVPDCAKAVVPIARNDDIIRVESLVMANFLSGTLKRKSGSKPPVDPLQGPCHEVDPRSRGSPARARLRSKTLAPARGKEFAGCGIAPTALARRAPL